MPLEAVKGLGGLEVVVNNQAKALTLEGGAYGYLEGQAGHIYRKKPSKVQRPLVRINQNSI